MPTAPEPRVPAGYPEGDDTLKTSKLQRKYVNQMRSMADVPWPARRFHIAPTFAEGVAKVTPVGECSKQVDEVAVKRRLRRKKTVPVLCGGRVVVKRGNLAKRRVYCEDCRARKAQRKLSLRLEQQARRFARADAREAVREDRRSARLLQRFRRSGSR